jgi:hypothetical protein
VREGQRRVGFDSRPLAPIILSNKGGSWLAFIYLLILLVLLALVLYLVPKREKIGGWLFKRVQLSSQGDEEKDKKDNGEES